MLLAGGKSALSAPITLTSGLKITGATRIKPGVYRLNDAGSGMVQVSGSGFTLDLQGAKIVGPGSNQGIGIHVTDARNILIKHADISHCLWGIVVERSSGVKLQDCVTSRNGDLSPGTVIDESGHEPEDNHGGGILIRDSRDCVAQRCTSQYQWDGIDVVRSENNVIEDGDYSYNGNWGLHLWDSSRNVFRRNRAIWCTTGAGTLFQALTGWQTYDSQAVGIDHNSNENHIEDNDLRFGGDAIFIRANEGPITPGTVVPPRNGSHRNVLRNNDCSYSPNNAIEVDLVDDTVIEGNNCSFSNYGMWLGYSRRCIIRNNICVNDSTHAVEIENGQGDLFANNVFGYDTPCQNGQLIYLRQNGRDKTPSGPYTLKDNLFYGAPIGVLFRATTANLTGNTFLWSGTQPARIAAEETPSQITQADNKIAGGPESAGNVQIRQEAIKPGALFTLSGIESSSIPPVVEVDGIPVWLRKVTQNEVVCWMPDDFWDRPAKTQVAIRVRTAAGDSPPVMARIAWPDNQPRITSLAPDPARLGDTVTITGTHLDGTRVLFNNKPAIVIDASPTQLQLKLPEGILVSTRYNLLVERGEGENQMRTWPITCRVDVPAAQQPHLVSATFSPTQLKVGERLQVTFVVRNNLPSPAPLLTQPKPPFTYDERQGLWDVGIQEVPGTLHLRVTSDHPAGHDPGSWPWLFGFDHDSLAPGETTTVTGYITVETPGEIEYRVGLVASGQRFIDDNAFRTRITVLP
jgi:parallel beta-helix repeat protein